MIVWLSSWSDHFVSNILRIPNEIRVHSLVSTCHSALGSKVSTTYLGEGRFYAGSCQDWTVGVSDSVAEVLEEKLRPSNTKGPQTYVM